jgi:hypothetical protein
LAPVVVTLAASLYERIYRGDRKSDKMGNPFLLVTPILP